MLCSFIRQCPFWFPVQRLKFLWWYSDRVISWHVLSSWRGWKPSHFDVVIRTEIIKIIIMVVTFQKIVFGVFFFKCLCVYFISDLFSITPAINPASLICYLYHPTSNAYYASPSYNNSNRMTSNFIYGTRSSFNQANSNFVQIRIKRTTIINLKVYL